MHKAKSLVSSFPHCPGVYLMRNSDSTIIYVGKAKDLKKRVSSYFLSGRDPKTTVLVSNIDDIEFIVTNSEFEALLLENNLIKKHQPKYNIALKDGKTYPVIRITDEPFPRLFRTRNIVNDGSTYFGPYTMVGLVDIYIELIKKTFTLRTCKGRLKKRKYACLYYHLDMCKGPCIGKIDSFEYMKEIDKIKSMLSGDTDDIRIFLKKEIDTFSKDLNFEKAKIYHDFLMSIDAVTTDQDVVDNNVSIRDYIAYFIKPEITVFCIFQMREGKLLGRDLFRVDTLNNEDEMLEQFLIQYYESYHEPPETIILGTNCDITVIQEYLNSRVPSRLSIRPPETKHESSVLNMVLSNCKIDMDRVKPKDKKEGLEELKLVFKLKRIPKIIEGFDIAHLHGKHTVASLVSFVDGMPAKSNYRHFKIKSLNGKIDDFESMREVTARRYSRLLNEGKRMPDLILIDGGQGQVNAVYGILKTLGLERIPVLGLAKKHEEVFLPNLSKPYILPEGNPGLMILQNVRDESHRFATSFNQELRKKGAGLG